MEKKYPKQVVVLGIHSPKFDSEKDPKSIKKAMQRYELHHPVLNDAERKTWKAYNVQRWPTIALIDPEGYVVGGLAQEDIFDQFDKAIAKLIRIHRERKTLNEKPIRFLKSPPKSGETPLFFPGKVVADAKGKRLFIADSTHHRIVITDLDGKKIAIAGSGEPGKHDGTFAAAEFNDPQGMALDGETLYVADRKNHLIRALDLKAKRVRTVAGTGYQSVFPPPAHSGPPRDVALNSPWDLLVHNKTLYIAMAGHHQIWALNLVRPWLALHAGTANEDIMDGSLRRACFAQPSGLATNGIVLFVADSEVSAIRSVSFAPTGVVRTLIGVGLFDFGDVDGVGRRRIRLQHALGVAYHDRKLYIADTYNSKVKVFDLTRGSCTTFAGGDKANPLFNEPGGISYANGKLYVADTNAHRIRVIDLKTKAVSTLKLQGVAPPGPPSRDR